MGKKRHRPEGVINRLQQAELELAKGAIVADASSSSRLPACPSGS